MFKKQVIKEDVYEPDWRRRSVATTRRRSPVCWRSSHPTGSTRRSRARPLGFKPKVTGDDVVEAYTSNVIDVVAHLVELKKKTGKIGDARAGAGAALLPGDDRRDDPVLQEPSLLAARPPSGWRRLTGLNEADAAQAMRDYTGVVFDIGHQAVGYEDIPASLQKLVDNGVQIVKLQEAAVDVHART